MAICSSHNLGKFAPSPSVFNFKLLTDVMLKLKKIFLLTILSPSLQRHATASPLNQCTARNILLTWHKNQVFVFSCNI